MDTTISICRTVDADAVSIWRALTQGIAAWQADQATGNVELGGHLLLAWPALGAEVDLDVVQVDVGRRLVLSTGSTHVTYEVDGSTVCLSHTGLADGDEADGTRASWQVALALLDQYLTRHEGRARQTMWAMQRATTTAAAAHVYFTDPAALGAWLTRSGGIGAEGEPVALELSWGGLLSGRVLAAVPGRDVALSWEEQGDSALVLRTLPAPFSDSERLLILAWSCWHREPNPAIVQRLNEALQRLARVLASCAEA